jgi:Cu/Ag efflux pump CusA
MSAAPADGRLRDRSDVADAVCEGAVERLRPKLMTVVAIMPAWPRSCGAEGPAPT